MTQVLLADICQAIRDTLEPATGLTTAQSISELTEGMNDTPTLQIYPESGNQDPTGSADRTTFRGGVRQTDVTIHADLYARQRSHIGEDMAVMVGLVDAITAIIEAQDTKPYFGLVGIQAFKWSWQRVTFEYAGANYTGARFIFSLRVF